MKGKHLSIEQREMIYSYCLHGKSARECHDAMFLGSDELCKLKNIQKIYNLCNDVTKEKSRNQYLSKSNKRGPQVKNNNGQWYDEIIDTLSSNYPTAPTIILRQHLEATIGVSEEVPSVSCINKCL